MASDHQENSLNSVAVAPPLLTVKHYGIGILSSGLKMIVLGFSLFLLFGLSEYRGYYDVDGIAVSKLKGFSVVNPNKSTLFLQNCQGCNDTLVFDSPEYSIIDDYDSFFVVTNLWITCDQSVGICGEDLNSAKGSGCVNDTDCSNGKVLLNGNGPQTGTCNITTKTCNVLAWCPVEAESDESTQYPKIDASNFTVLIKNSVSFPTSSSKYTRSNIYGGYEQSGLDNCTYDKDKSPGCPIFTLGQIVEMISPKQNFTELSRKGAVLIFNIEWNCILDELWTHHDCTPVYSVTRQGGDNSSYDGDNTRFTTNRYVTNGTLYRTLVKAYGIRVIVRNNGQGGMASISAVTTWLTKSWSYYSAVTSFLMVLLVYGYLTYYIDVINYKKKDEISLWSSLLYITKGMIYFLLSGICCSCIILPVIYHKVFDNCECNKCKTQKIQKCFDYFTIDCSLRFIANVINVCWMICFAILIGIPLIVLALIMLLIFAIPSGVAFLFCKDRLTEVVNKVLRYELDYNTYAAQILRKTWDNIDKFQEEKTEVRRGSKDTAVVQTNSKDTAKHVVIEFA